MSKGSDTTSETYSSPYTISFILAKIKIHISINSLSTTCMYLDFGPIVHFGQLFVSL